jgi:hypothetical protein
MNISHQKANVFSTQGFQTGRFIFYNLTKKFGKPRAVSQNGQFFIFAKLKQQGQLKCNIMMATEKRMVLVKEVDLMRDILGYLEDGVVDT